MTQRDDLERLRVVLFEALEGADVAVKAQVAGQLRAVVKDLAGLDVETVEVSKADDLAARRKARRTGAAGAALADGRGQPRKRGTGD